MGICFYPYIIVKIVYYIKKSNQFKYYILKLFYRLIFSKYKLKFY